MFSPDGIEMCRLSAEKAQWYLSKNLAQPMDEPKCIKLNFKPNGLGFTRCQDFYFQNRKNKCVVCGSEKDLSRHHIVPKYCRRAISNGYLIPHDVLMVYQGYYPRVASTLLRYGDVIPEHKKQYLIGRIQQHLGKVPTKEDLVELSEVPYYRPTIDYGKELVRFYGNCGIIKQFRKHFLETMKPQFMPDNWDVNHDYWLDRKDWVKHD